MSFRLFFLRLVLCCLALPGALVGLNAPAAGAGPVSGSAAGHVTLTRPDLRPVFQPNLYRVAATPVSLTCRADVAMPAEQRDALCAALRRALASQIGAARMRETATPGTLPITLRLTRATARIIEGHLEWPAGGRKGGRRTVGPPVLISADDMPLGPVLYPSFASGLLQVSKLPL